MSTANQGDLLTVTVNGPCDCSILLREYDSADVATGRTLNTTTGMTQVEPGKYRLSSAFFSAAVGTFTWKIDLGGSAACASGLSIAGTAFSFTIRAIPLPAADACAACTVAGIGAGAVVTDLVLADGAPFEFSVPLTGTQPFTFCAKSLPSGITADIVGNIVVVTGLAKQGRVAFAVQNGCSCQCATFTRVIGQSAAGAVQVVCPVVVDITNDTIDIIGTSRTWTITAADPTCTTVSVTVVGRRNGNDYIDVFNATLPFTRVDPPSTLGLVETLSVTVLAACGPVCPQATKLITKVPGGCEILLTTVNQLITAPGLFRSYVITSPSGTCTQANLVTTGTINGVSYATQGVVSLPYNYIDATASVAGDDSSVLVNFTGVGDCAGAKVCGDNTRMITKVPSVCLIGFSLTELSFIVGQKKSQTYTAVNLPIGGILVLDLYEGSVLVPGASVTLTYAKPSQTYDNLLFPQFTVGRDYNYRARLPLFGTATSCTVFPARADFDVYQSEAACAITWSIRTNTFVAGVATPQTYTSSGIPVGGAVTFRLYLAGVVQSFGSFTLSSVTPSYSPAPLTFPPGSESTMWEYRPDIPTGTAMACNVAPPALGFTVTGASGANTGALMTGTSNGCGAITTPPAPPAPPAPTPAPSSGSINATINAGLAFDRVLSNPSNSSTLWPQNTPFIIQMDITPAMFTSSRFLATFNVSDSGPVRADRIVTLSQTPGDFSVSAQRIIAVPSNAGSATMKIGPDVRTADVAVTTGRWYINIKNVSNAGDFLVDLAN